MLQKAIELIRSFEGLEDGDPLTVNLDPYIDPIGVWTIGWGHAIRDGNGFLIRGKQNKARAIAVYPDGISLDEAVILLMDDIRGVVADINRLVRIKLKDHQMSALVSFVFNLGVGNFQKSTLLKLINVSEFDKAAEEFPKWNKAGGKVLKGLTRRRLAEAECFKGL